jgi:CMP-N-acetylneuraminic acid synthetase
MKIVAVIPVKLNNERAPGKNTKCFFDGTPLIKCIQEALRRSKYISDIYVYCSKDAIKNYLIDGIKYLPRDPVYDSPEAAMNDILYSFSREVESDIYVLAHATAPFLKTESIDKSIEAVSSWQYDSALAVVKMQEFMWQNNRPLNYDLTHIPRTQDLPVVFVETTGLYTFTREVIQNFKTRIGRKPLLLEVGKIESIDINYPEDFTIAEAVYGGLLNRQE